MQQIQHPRTKRSPGAGILVGLVLALAPAVLVAAPATSPVIAASGRSSCELLVSESAASRAIAEDVLQDELARLVEIAGEFNDALAGVARDGQQPGQAARLQSLLDQQLAQWQRVLPDIPGATTARESLSAWILLAEGGVDLNRPADPCKRAQARKLALLDAALGLAPVGRAELGQYLRRLRNIGDFLAETTRPGGRDRTQALATASFDLDGHFEAVHQRYANALSDRGSHWQLQCTACAQGVCGGDVRKK